MPKTPSNAADWHARELRIAAVEYAVQQCGEPPKAGDPGSAQFHARLATVANTCGLPSDGGERMLLNWMRDRSLRGSYDKGERHDAPGGDARRGFEAANFAARKDEAYTVKAASLPEIAEGAVPASMPDPLMSLLAQEDSALDAAERERIAGILETGEGLTDADAAQLAAQLRTCSMAAGREIVRAVLDYVAPLAGTTQTVWEARHRRIPLKPGRTWQHMDMPPLPGALTRWPQLSRSCLIISDDGAPVLFLPFARAAAVAADSRPGRKPRLALRYLAPRKVFARDLVLRQFALLASMVRGDSRTAKEWANIFHETKAATSYTRKKLDARVRADSGAVAVFRGLKAKPDPRKGTTKSKNTQQPPQKPPELRSI